MKIGLASYNFVNNNINFNLAQIEKALCKARGRAELLCFGEAFLQGFDAMNWDYEHDRDIAIAQDDAIIRNLCKLTCLYGVDLLLGYLERENDSLYSSCILIESGRILHNYRRISEGWNQYWRTDEHYCEGDEVHDFDYKGITMRIALCGDIWEFPERFKTDALLIWPVCCNFTTDEWEEKYKVEYAEQALKAARQSLFIDAIDSDSNCIHAAFCFKNGVVAQELLTPDDGILFIEL